MSKIRFYQEERKQRNESNITALSLVQLINTFDVYKICSLFIQYLFLKDHCTRTLASTVSDPRPRPQPCGYLWEGEGEHRSGTDQEYGVRQNPPRSATIHIEVTEFDYYTCIIRINVHIYMSGLITHISRWGAGDLLPPQRVGFGGIMT